MSNLNKKVVEPKGVPTAEQKQTSTALVVLPKEEPRRISADERIENAQRFSIITRRYDLLLGKKNELEKFLLQNDGLSGLRLCVENGKGNEFEISNAVVISDLLSGAQKKVSELLQQTENDVLTFEI